MSTTKMWTLGGGADGATWWRCRCWDSCRCLFFSRHFIIFLLMSKCLPSAFLQRSSSTSSVSQATSCSAVHISMGGTQRQKGEKPAWQTKFDAWMGTLMCHFTDRVIYDTLQLVLQMDASFFAICFARRTVRPSILRLTVIIGWWCSIAFPSQHSYSMQRKVVHIINTFFF